MLLSHAVAATPNTYADGGGGGGGGGGCDVDGGVRLLADIGTTIMPETNLPCCCCSGRLYCCCVPGADTPTLG